MPTNNGDITFKYGTQSAYNNLSSVDENAIYVTTDTHRIYIGGADYTNDTQMNDATKQYVDSTATTVNSRIDNIIANRSPTDGNSELVDIRIGADRTVYTSAGEAVRKQIEKTKSNIDAHLESINRRLGFSDDAVVENSEFIQGAYIDSNGYRSEGVYANMRTHNKLLPLSDYIVHLSSYPENMLVSIGLYSDGNGTWLRLYPNLVPIVNGEYSVDTEDILAHFPGATHIRLTILSYADNTYYDISDVNINVYNQQGQTIVDQVENLSESLDDYRESLDSQNVRLQKLEDLLEQLGFPSVPSAVLGDADFVAGGYVDSNGYRTDGNYSYMRTHHKLLPLDSYIVVLGNYISDMLITAGLYSDENGSWLRAYPMLAQVTNGVYTVDAEDILAHFPGATHIRLTILSYADNTYYDISDVNINVYNQQGQTIVDQVEDLSESLDDYGESLDSQNVRLQKLESNKFILPLFNRGYKSINIIGDSISQGAAASSISNDSYCGILRKMFFAEFGGRLNYGFSAFDKSTDLGFDSSTVTWVYGSPMYGWQRNFADSSVLGGDSYTSSATNSRFCFKLWKNSHYLQIAIVGGSDKGCFELQNGNGNVIAEIDCSTYPQGACLTDKIDISEIDASNGYEFLIVTKSADTVIISGVSLSDNDDYWTFNNYGRAGASPSVFTGDIFDKESRCSVLIYALGVNSGIDNLNNALASIKNTAKSLNAQKIVLCLCFKGNGFDNRSGGKPQAMKAFSDEIGALFIDVYEHCPKDSNGYPVNGILSQDNIHPTDEGHRFIAELIAKNIGLSCNSKGIVSSMV